MRNYLQIISKASMAIAIMAVVFLACVAQTPGQSPTAKVDETGFESIFDGKTLQGWEFDPKFWRVENGLMAGEVTAENTLKQNTFIIWRGGLTRDFELKLEYRISGSGNSGVNYRSAEVPGIPLALRGYQVDIDGQSRNANDVRHTGQNYEERGRAFLARRGEMAHLAAGKKPVITASLGSSKELGAFIKNDDWNELHLIARGNVMIHVLNGKVMSVVIDDDIENRRLEGLLGMQVHAGPPMKIEFRNIRLKQLSKQ